MKSRTLGWVVLVALASTVLGRASQGDTISHGVPPDPGDTVPTGSEAICPGIPAGVALIPGLRTGRAIRSSTSGALRLLFSDLPLACQDRGPGGINGIAHDLCVSAWSVRMLLLPEMQAPGVYVLADYPDEVELSFATMNEFQKGCGGVCSGGGFDVGGVVGAQGPAGASLEIYSVTDDCITGRLHGLTTGLTTSTPLELDGAFHAVRCTPNGVATAADSGGPALR